MNKNSISNREREYERSFNAMLRGKATVEDLDTLSVGKNLSVGTYALPSFTAGKFMGGLKDNGLFRNIASLVSSKGDSTVYAFDYEDKATWVPEGGQIPLYDGEDDFSKFSIGFYKLVANVTLSDEFVYDSGFNVSKYVTDHLAKSMARAEDDAFINGNGVNMPTGILCEDKGAETAVTTDELTYDNLIKLFLSVKPEYRKNGTWLMNDNTALILRSLKDSNGNYLWNPNTDTILSKPVEICEFMPDAEYGKMPIAFGDFGYYWIIDREHVSTRMLNELYAASDRVGYLGVEFLDGLLTRREAIKTICMSK